MIFTRIRRNTKGLTLAEAGIFVGFAFCIIAAAAMYHVKKQEELFTQTATLADAEPQNLLVEDVSGAFSSSIKPDAHIALVYHAPETAPDEARNARLLCVWSQGEQVHPMVIGELSNRWVQRYVPIDVNRDSSAYVPLAALCDRVAT